MRGNNTEHITQSGTEWLSHSPIGNCGMLTLGNLPTRNGLLRMPPAHCSLRVLATPTLSPSARIDKSAICWLYLAYTLDIRSFRRAVSVCAHCVATRGVPLKQHRLPRRNLRINNFKQSPGLVVQKALLRTWRVPTILCGDSSFIEASVTAVHTPPGFGPHNFHEVSHP